MVPVGAESIAIKLKNTSNRTLAIVLIPRYDQEEIVQKYEAIRQILQGQP